MSGLKLTIPTTFSDLTLPKYHDDPVFPDAGALLLIEPGHPLEPWAAGVPPVAAGQTVPNLVWQQAQALIAGSSKASLAGALNRGNGWGQEGSILERSSKGGLHGIHSPTLATTGVDNNASVQAPDAIKTYTLANPGHDFYASVWQRVTRPYTPQPNLTWDNLEWMNYVSATSNYRMQLVNDNGGSNYPNVAGNNRKAANSVGPQFSNNHSAGWGVGVPPAAPAGLDLTGFIAGASSSVYAYQNALKRGMGTRVMYRWYLEDLTVSGRSYAQVDALDLAEYTRQVLTAGGRYYGDTFTDPATVA